MTPESASTSEVMRAVTRYLGTLPYTRWKAEQEKVNFLVIEEAVGDVLQTLPYTQTPQEPTHGAVSVAVDRRLHQHGISIDPRDVTKSKEAFTVGDLSKPKPDEGDARP
jgi:hypothetical protein